MNKFKLVPAKCGSGWVGVYVAVDHYFGPSAAPGEMCLTAEGATADEVGELIDELIDELESLKLKAKAKFEGWEVTESNE